VFECGALPGVVEETTPEDCAEGGADAEGPGRVSRVRDWVERMRINGEWNGKMGSMGNVHVAQRQLDDT